MENQAFWHNTAEPPQHRPSVAWIDNTRAFFHDLRDNLVCSFPSGKRRRAEARMAMVLHVLRGVEVVYFRYKALRLRFG